ncbi:hypothetical protein YpsIP31758_2962 [Yersinia pseudotuberculosis IP 31758]|uniref:Uncharacterized protein n=1 Tax=Yersinia pseudotuberculosis serotype O:1b (strain IP 31758) TaxID=349747 RepID=A0A0U1QV29_YERP3|nr:hypothetical protein YpsIP31758_2962 [Yersinia pseudotuberculosis IP 31758]
MARGDHLRINMVYGFGVRWCHFQFFECCLKHKGVAMKTSHQAISTVVKPERRFVVVMTTPPKERH